MHVACGDSVSPVVLDPASILGAPTGRRPGFAGFLTLIFEVFEIEVGFLAVVGGVVGRGLGVITGLLRRLPGLEKLFAWVASHSEQPVAQAGQAQPTKQDKPPWEASELDGTWLRCGGDRSWLFDDSKPGSRGCEGRDGCCGGDCLFFDDDCSEVFEGDLNETGLVGTRVVGVEAETLLNTEGVEVDAGQFADLIARDG